MTLATLPPPPWPWDVPSLHRARPLAARPSGDRAPVEPCPVAGCAHIAASHDADDRSHLARLCRRHRYRAHVAAEASATDIDSVADRMIAGPYQVTRATRCTDAAADEIADRGWTPSDEHPRHWRDPESGVVVAWHLALATARRRARVEGAP